MKELIINTPDGYVSLISSEYEKLITYNYIDINFLFWQEIFSDENIKKTIEYAKIRYINSRNIPLKIQVILNDTALFCNNLKKALSFKFTHNTTKQEFFSCVETLEMFCELFTLCRSSPYKLTITEGFAHNKDASDFLNEYCLNEHYNPYLSFIQLSVIPQLIDKSPDIVWLTGRPNIATFAIIKLIKINSPHIHIILCDPKTEYFSLYKIKDLLVHNTILFNLVDCILFSSNEKNRKMIVENIIKNKEHKNVHGCIYKSGTQIICNEATPMVVEESYNHQKINLKLFKNNSCYWNKCSFCGINQKYEQHNNSHWDIAQAINILKTRHNNGNKYMWLIDEAIPPAVLKELVSEFSKNNFKFIWHFRTRIEPSLLDSELISLLVNNGVKSIILGFESASHRILQLMNKTTYDNYLMIAEKIVEEYTSIGIHIHFPVLIGFPTETDSERQKSFQFVEYLSKKYPLFSYNINILELDISSILFKKWTTYDITQLKFPCLPKFFLGNCVEWEYNEAKLNHLRTVQMKKQFSWYPDESYLSINVFYNLWEQKKGLLCIEDFNNDINTTFALDAHYILNSNIVMFKLITDEYCIYQYDTHNFICGSELINYTYNAFLESSSISEIITRYHYINEEILIKFLSDLFDYKFIIQK